MAPIPHKVQNLWRDYTGLFGQTSGIPAFRANPGNTKYEWFQLRYNNRVLRYAVKLLPGTKPRPASGYPLYIALHGGGGYQLGDTRSNDLNWWGMANGFYYDTLESHVRETGEGALYVATRGVSTWEAQLPRDTYDIHSQPESYVLLNRMIKGMFLPTPAEIECLELGSTADVDADVAHQDTTYADPNRVYLLGFSAGGDGVFQLSARMPDLFAAAGAGAGHPNWVKFDNLTNLPIFIQCGETDSTDTADGDVSGVKDRAVENVRNSQQLDKLKSQAQELFRNCPQPFSSKALSSHGFYRHECGIVQGKGHNAWAQPGLSSTAQPVLKNLASWLRHKQGEADEADADEMVQRVINPVRWASDQAPRDPTPPFVVWNLSARPTEPDLGTDHVWFPVERSSWVPKRFLYWLFLRETRTQPPADSLAAAYDRESNSIWVAEEAAEHVGLLVNEDMMDFGVDVNVYIGPSTIRTLRLRSSEKLQTETLWARGDPNLVFGTMLVCRKDGEDWTVEATDTLGPGVVQGMF